MHTDSMDTLYAYPISRIYMYALYENLYALRRHSLQTLYAKYVFYADSTPPMQALCYA